MPTMLPENPIGHPLPRMPWWGWMVLAGFAAFEPLAHLWLLYGLPDTLAHSGLHIGDDSFFLPAMEMFRTGFFSPYATCQHAAGYHDPVFFTVPLSWMLAILSYVPLALGANTFLLLGFINGAAVLAYGLGAWAFLRRAVPTSAARAFLLFLLAGGLGGVLFVASASFGWTQAPGFEVAFHRYARYELIEGPFLQVWAIQYRAYYTVPLALGWWAFSVFLRDDAGRTTRVAGWCAFLLASFINARVTPFLWVGMACYTACTARSVSAWGRLAVYALAPVIGFVYTMAHMAQNPESLQSCFELLRRSAWLGSLASAGFFLWCFATLALPSAGRALPPLVRVGLYIALGYLAAFALGYAAYQTYYGNWLGRGDAAAAVAISDPALLGALAGGLFGLWRWNVPRTPVPGAWVFVWIALVLCASVSAFFHGEYLRFMPERGMAVLGPPLAMAATLGLDRLRSEKLRRGLVAVCVACGVCSAAVSMLHFHLPLAYTPGQGPFVWNHHEVITPNEAAVIAEIPGGEVVAPASAAPLYSDFIVHLRDGVMTPYGQATLNLSAQSMSAMAAEVLGFFDPATNEEARKVFVDRWCIGYVFCPETNPVAPETLSQFAQTPWLEPVVRVGECRLYAVVR